ncbi:hypothetical protein BDP27DRAFT_1332761 [Rhodocollybia butyracea]|uniref:Uncharacterized protein n=1 Tax=Rhodocollybia butyracea TaxID=206335 RepID=A0A9P5U3X6_9AGAR|nr:hypothetical protein BDP27DRAFT_1332761 [Rhodocollybia butyracea]
MTATPDFAVPRLVVVDDTDPNIRYSPSSAFSLDTKGSLNGVGWGGDVFNQTITGTTVNASLSYTFNGTFVRAMVAAEGEIEWNCSVDGRNIGTVLTQFVDQVTNFIACDSAGTLEGTTGPHTLDPLPSDPLDSVTLRIHNSDPSVRYSNSSEDWIWQGGQANATHSNGASVDFAFNGSSVALYTIVLSNSGPMQFDANKAFYLLDGNSNSTSFDLPASMKANNTGNYTDILNYPLFTVPNLSTSPHDIKVGTAYNTSDLPQYLAIDYFLIKTHPHVSSSLETSGNSSSSDNGSGHKNIGAIIGGTFAGVAGLSALFLILWFVRRRKEGKYMMLNPTGSSPGYYRSTGGEDATLEITPFEYDSQVLLALQDEQNQRNEIRQHLDSGVRIPSADDAIEDVPPTYTED